MLGLVSYAEEVFSIEKLEWNDFNDELFEKSIQESIKLIGLAPYIAAQINYNLTTRPIEQGDNDNNYDLDG